MICFHYARLGCTEMGRFPHPDKDELVLTSLSLFFLKKQFKVIQLITDKAGHDILIHQARLPYDSVQILPDAIAEPLQHTLAMLSFLRYQPERFLLVNHQVILTRPLTGFPNHSAVFLYRFTDNAYVETVCQLRAATQASDYPLVPMVFNMGIWSAEPSLIADYHDDVIHQLAACGEGMPHQALLATFFANYYWNYFIDSHSIPIYLLMATPTMPDSHQKPYLVFRAFDDQAIIQLDWNRDSTLDPLLAALLAFKLKINSPLYYERIQQLFAGLSQTGALDRSAGAVVTDTYSRTRAALLQGCGLNADIPQTDFGLDAYLHTGLADLNTKIVTAQFIRDVFHFETARANFSKHINADQFMIDADSNFMVTNALFNQEDTADLLSSTFSLSPYVSLVEADWNWAITYPDGVDRNVMDKLKVIYNAAEPPGYYQTIFWFNTHRNMIEEYLLSSLSSLLLHHLLDGYSVQTTLEQVGGYYGVQDEPGVFWNLALEHLRELMTYKFIISV